MSKKRNSNIAAILKEDGVGCFTRRFENQRVTNIAALNDIFKTQKGYTSWSARLPYNSRFQGTLICQSPGEGNRLHHHPDSDECWVIVSGEWEWFIEGEGVRKVNAGEVVIVRQGENHKITCVGQQPGIRFAITAPDAAHVHVDE